MKLFQKITTLLFVLGSISLHASLEVKSVNPSNGSTLGGNVVTIKGSGFSNTTSVKFGKTPATVFSVISDKKIVATAPTGAAGTVDIRITSNGHTSHKKRSDFYTYTQDAWHGILSVKDQDNVTIFDTGTNATITTIPLAVDSLASIITPNGKTIYAIDSSQPNIIVIDAATNLITHTFPLSPIVGSGSFDLCISPDGKKLYVSNNLSGYVSVIDTKTEQVEANIFVVTNLGSISITPDGKKVYVANFNFSANTVSIIDTATNSVIGNLSTGLTPGLVSVTPNGTKGFVGNSLTDTISVIDIATDTITNTIHLPTGAGPYGSSILPNGETIYVTNIYNDTVTVIDVASETILATISVPTGTGPFWAAATPDGQTVYCANLNTSNVTPINTATNTAGTQIVPVLGANQDIVMSPDPAPVASFTFSGTAAGSVTTFNASNSISPIGTIVEYAWDFGDGTTLSTPNPIVNHIFTSGNTFKVTLTVTNSAGTSISKIFSSRFMSNNGDKSAVISQHIEIAPSPVRHLKGFQTCEVKCCCKKLVNTITWKAPSDHGRPDYYLVYRDSSLKKCLSKVSGRNPLTFIDLNIKGDKTYTYYVVAVGKSGIASEPNSVTVRPVETCKKLL